MGWRAIAVLGLLALALGVAGFVHFAPNRVEEIVERVRPPQDHAAFARWLAESEQHRRDFAQFDSFLATQGVREVVPSWQLVRSDGSVGAVCSGNRFEVPPRALWPNVVPVLRLVGQEIAPHTGPLEANSIWRSPQANRCMRGASRSQHLTFSGVDFVTQRKMDNRALFRLLCDLHAKLGPRSRFGLGAYFDPAEPKKNAKGQFHVDLAGYRSWGFDYGKGSSGCLTFPSGG